MTERNTTFIILILISIILMLLSKTEFGKKMNIKLTEVLNPLTNWVDRLMELAQVRKENEELRKLIGELEMKIQLYQNLKNENEDLRKLLNLPVIPSYEIIAAEITGLSHGLFPAYAIINKGKEDGVKNQMPVTVNKGVYGKVINAGNHYSRIETIYGHTCRISATIKRKGVNGVVKYSPDIGLVLDYVEIDANVRKGDTVITSGMGEVFPKGLLIGKVTEVDTNPDKLRLIIKIEPFYRIKNQKFVYVLKRK